jgi:hypothetical protein
LKTLGASKGLVKTRKGSAELRGSYLKKSTTQDTDFAFLPPVFARGVHVMYNLRNPIVREHRRANRIFENHNHFKDRHIE